MTERLYEISTWALWQHFMHGTPLNFKVLTESNLISTVTAQQYKQHSCYAESAYASAEDVFLKIPIEIHI